MRKTTVLRLIAGLDTPDSGSIRCGDEVWYDGARAANRIDIAPQHRRVGYLSQDYAIFPHLTVRRNVAYSHAARGWDIDGLLSRFELSGLARSMRPHACACAAICGNCWPACKCPPSWSHTIASKRWRWAIPSPS